ncbi:MAG: protein kinase [Lentisphaerae bacterium]|nr:protein kinase [Lentisphaerota bacterium]
MSPRRTETANRPLATVGDYLFGRYRILERLSRNGRSAVFRATDDVRRETVALKLLLFGQRQSLQAEAFLRQTLAIAERLTTGDAFIQVYDCHRRRAEGGTLVAIAMEYADGGSFRDWLHSNAGDVGARHNAGIDIFRDICCCVAELHACGVLHLDIKPGNFLFLREGIRLADWETSVIQGEESSATECDGAQGWRYGTTEYMSPDVIRAHSAAVLDERADIYSLGIILHELLSPTCRPPFTGSRRRVRGLQLEMVPPAPPGIAAPFVRVLDRMLDKAPSGRYRTVDEILSEVDPTDHGSAGGGAPRPGSAEECVKLWHDVELKMAERSFAEARHLCDAILELVPDDPHALQVKGQIEGRFAEAEGIYAHIANTMGSADLEEALGLVQEAVDIYPEHPAGRMVQTQLGQRGESYRQHMALARKAIEAGDLISACCYAKAACRVNPGSPIPEAMLARLSERLELRRSLKAQVERAVASRDFGRALHLAEELDRMDAQRVCKRTKERPGLVGRPQPTTIR